MKPRYDLLLLALTLLLSSCGFRIPRLNSGPSPDQIPASATSAPSTPTPEVSSMQPPGSPTATGTESSAIAGRTPGSTPFSRSTASPSPPILRSPQPSATPSSTPAGPGASELLFLADDRLGTWNPASLSIHLLATKVREYSPSADGQKIALLRTRQVTANGSELFDLAVLDIPGGTITPLASEIQRVYNLSISPDGLWITYSSQQNGGYFYLVSAEQASQPLRLGSCEQEMEMSCDGKLVWSPHSDAVLWSDRRGLWIRELDQTQAQLVLPEKLEISDPKGSKTAVGVTYTDLQPWPKGRFVLATIAPRSSEVHWLSLIDLSLGRVADLPGTFTLQGEAARAVWLPDGGLFVAQRTSPQEPQYIKADLWRVVATSENMLQLEKSLQIDVSQFVGASGGLQSRQGFFPQWLAALNERLVSFAPVLPDTLTLPTLLTYDIKYGTTQQIQELPYDTQQVLWAPDLSGALILGRHDQILFAPAVGEAMYNLRQALGVDAQTFIWLPAAQK